MKLSLSKLRNGWPESFTAKALRKSIRRKKADRPSDPPGTPNYISLDGIIDFEEPEVSLEDQTASRKAKTRLFKRTNINSNFRNAANEIQTSCGVRILLEHCCSEMHTEDSLSPPVCGLTDVVGETKQWKIRDYSRAEKKIYESITFFCDNSVIVWCPLLEVKGDYVESLLPKFGKVISIHDRWIPDDFAVSEESWGGVLAIYETRSMAKKAAKGIPIKSDFVKTLQVSKLLRCLVKSELLHPSFETGTTQLIVLGGKSVDSNSIQDLQSLLLKFGAVESMRFYDQNDETDVICEVNYIYAAHAFLALTILDGLPFGPGVLTAFVREGAKEHGILNNLTFELGKYIGQAYFPFKKCFKLEHLTDN